MTITRSAIAHMAIREFMSTFVITIQPFETVARAFEIMSVNRIRHLPVKHDERLVGIITWTDVLELKSPDPGHRFSLGEVAKSLEALTVSTVMTRDLITAHPTQPLGYAADLMLEHKVGSLPVLDSEQQLVGLVTESNIFRTIARRWRDDNEIFSGAKRP